MQKICWKYARNMQKYAGNMQIYAKIMQGYANNTQEARNMQTYRLY